MPEAWHGPPRRPADRTDVRLSEKVKADQWRAEAVTVADLEWKGKPAYDIEHVPYRG
jgi:hypothetical protein